MVGLDGVGRGYLHLASRRAATGWLGLPSRSSVGAKRIVGSSSGRTNPPSIPSLPAEIGSVFAAYDNQPIRFVPDDMAHVRH